MLHCVGWTTNHLLKKFLPNAGTGRQAKESQVNASLHCIAAFIVGRLAMEGMQPRRQGNGKKGFWSLNFARPHCIALLYFCIITDAIIIIQALCSVPCYAVLWSVLKKNAAGRNSTRPKNLDFESVEEDDHHLIIIIILSALRWGSCPYTHVRVRE